MESRKDHPIVPPQAGLPGLGRGGRRHVVSASRRTDLTAHFPEYFADAVRAGEARVLGPAGFFYAVDLRPEAVHSVVLVSKDFRNLLDDRFGLREALSRYDQLSPQLTVTGLGGTRWEPGVATIDETLSQLPDLVRLAGDPRRVCVRFDPVVFWTERGRTETNAPFYERVIDAAAAAGIEDVRFSIVQWYGKVLRRMAGTGMEPWDPPAEMKQALARDMAAAATARGLRLHACAQASLADGTGALPPSCIDGRRLRELHPARAPVSLAKDRGQRKECLCTVSKDIGSYTQACPHACLYCYANPLI